MEEEEVLDARNVLESVGSNASTISMSSVIRSLKEELKKLRSPKILRTINRLLITSVLLLCGIMAFNVLEFNTTSHMYHRSIRISIEIMAAINRVLISYDQLLMVDILDLTTGNQKWREKCIRQCEIHVAASGAIMREHSI